jgi:hypothetical protein
MNKENCKRTRTTPQVKNMRIKLSKNNLASREGIQLDKQLKNHQLENVSIKRI